MALKGILSIILAIFSLILAILGLILAILSLILAILGLILAILSFILAILGHLSTILALILGVGVHRRDLVGVCRVRRDVARIRRQPPELALRGSPWGTAISRSGLNKK